MPKMKACIH